MVTKILFRRMIPTHPILEIKVFQYSCTKILLMKNSPKVKSPRTPDIRLNDPWPPTFGPQTPLGAADPTLGTTVISNCTFSTVKIYIQTTIPSPKQHQKTAVNCKITVFSCILVPLILKLILKYFCLINGYPPPRGILVLIY